MNFLKITAFSLMLLALCSCKDQPKDSNSEQIETEIKQPFTVQFDADSAYRYVQEQVDFGPRVPGSAAHGKTARYLEQKLAQFCDTAFTQYGYMKGSKGSY